VVSSNGVRGISARGNATNTASYVLGLDKREQPRDMEGGERTTTGLNCLSG